MSAKDYKRPSLSPDAVLRCGLCGESYVRRERHKHRRKHLSEILVTRKTCPRCGISVLPKPWQTVSHNYVCPVCCRKAVNQRRQPPRRTAAQVQREREQKREYFQRRYRDPEAKLKMRSRIEAFHAARRGIIKKTPCTVCGSDAFVQAHHTDYTKPLEVVWLCRKCHGGLHRIEPTVTLSQQQLTP